ncbi:MAG: dehydrogenase [Bacteriovoracaceae bacterium]|nr:dehydrogenase [Bacteriovoracaceae bacterium]
MLEKTSKKLVPKTSKKTSTKLAQEKEKNSHYDHKLKLVKKYNLSKEILNSMLRNVFLSRKLDDTEITMKKQTKAYFQISGAGHEGILSAATQVLKPAHDWFIPYYRDRALCTGLGVTGYDMLCQANGNVGDKASHGRQMPAHWGDVDLNIVSKSSCTGTQFLHAVGIAEAGRYLEEMENKGLDLEGRTYYSDEIIYTSCGDGTTSQGEFWEGLSTAIVNKLPVMFMVEDNGYAISVPTKVQTPGESISVAFANMPGLKIYKCNGSCPVESYATMFEAARYIRKERKPVLIHASVTRPYSHSLSDDQSMYRTKEELEAEKVQDVFNSYPKFLTESGLFTKKEVQKLLEDITLEVREEMKRAIDTPWPDVSTSTDHIYSDDIKINDAVFETEPQFSGKEDVPMAGSINAVLKSEFKRNPFNRMWGEDVADFSQLEKLDNPDLKGKGGVFKVTSGVQRNSQEGQVFNSPLAEANVIGRAIGQAMRGIKPVVEIQFFDYIWTAYMQLKNEMATTRYRSGGDYTSPMVVRVPIGGYLRGGSIYHSQCGESLFTHIPGIRVAFPSNALDAAGLLRTAVRADDPVMFLEHKHLYYQGYNRTADPGAEYMIPFGKARIAREGTDATVFCWGALVQKSIEAAKVLEAERYSVEVIDARTLAPFDMDAIVTSLKKTNRLLIAHEETKTSGFAGEIAARVNEECFEALDAPIMRVAAKDSYVAYCPQLEDDILPQKEDVVTALRKLVAY